MSKLDDLTRARNLSEEGRTDTAWAIVKQYLNDDPNDVQALVIAGFIYEKANNIEVAYQLYRRMTELQPLEAGSWINYGRAAQDMWQTTEAERAYQKGLQYAVRAESKRMLLGNLSALMIDQGRYTEGEKYARRALEVDPTMQGALTNLGFCQLAKGNWAEGWKNYHHCIGTDWRKKVVYKDEPEWDGTNDKTVVLYGEQGLGDEIVFASMVPDVAKRCKKLIVDCDPRLTGLFKRSFPMATVYGTRNAKAADGLGWAKEDCEIDYSLASGQAGEFVRTESFPREPYLIADPERVTMWRALWATKKKPVIGIAWAGGIQKTGAKHRFCDLTQWKPLFESVDAHYVSLQYRSAAKELKDFPQVHEYPYATLSKDYDDTAALVASLDAVIGVPTSVIHLAGALGAPTFAMNAKMKCWKYASGNPFHPCTMIEWMGDWQKTIAATIPHIQDLLGLKKAA